MEIRPSPFEYGFPAKAVSRGPALLRDINLRIVLQLLRAHHPCSCSDLARYSGLSVPTVASSVARLEQLGLAKRVGKGSSNGGRPPRLVRFNETYGYVAGIDIDGPLIRAGIADLSGQMLGESTGEIGEKTWPMAVVEQITHRLGALREDLRIPAKRLMAVGVSAPGITDVNAGVVVSVPNMQSWENVPLGRLLHEKLRVPVIVENVANLAALGEYSAGVAQGERDFVFVHMGRGVGAGLMINGEVHHGPEWTAGEIGYLHASGGKTQPVRKSQVGALEAAIGTFGIQRQWREAMERGDVASDAPSAVEILDSAVQGDAAAKAIMDKTSDHLAMVCSYLSLILNCSLIVFGGELGRHPALFEETVARLEGHDFAHPRLAITQLGEKAQLIGALRLALKTAETALP